MLFAGDNAQLVFGNTGKYIEDIKNSAKYKPFRTYTLTSNYRSTKEIADFAVKYSGLDNTEIKCVRQGSEPKVISCGSNLTDELNKYISECAEKGYKSVAVLCLNQKEADSLKPVIESPDETVRISVLPVYMAKGLEFDCAAVVNCGGRMKESDRKNGTCVLYTACTRAMHDLAVFE